MSSSTSRAPGKSTGRFTVIHNLNAILHISQLFCSAPLYQLKLPPSEPATSATKGALTAITAKLCAIVGALLRFVHILYSLTYAVMLFYVVVRGTRLTDRYNMAIVEVCIIFTRFLCNNMTTVLILLGCQIRPQRFQRFVDEVTTIDRRLSRLDEERPPHSDAQHLAAPPNDDGDDDAALTIGLYLSPAVRASLRCSLVSVVALLSALSFLDYADAGFTMAAAAKTHIVYILPACTLCLSMLQFVAALRLLEHMFGRVVGLVQRVLGGRQIMRGSGDGDGDSIAWGGAETSKRQSLTPLLLLKRKRRESVRSAASVASSSTTASGGAGGDAAAYLNALRLEHIRLTRIYNGILDGYGLAVLGIVLTSIMDLTLQVFFFYKVAVNLTTATWTYMVYAALWVLMIIGRIFFAVSMCDRVNTVRHEIVPVMFQIELDAAIIRPDVNRVIDEFAMQLLHDNNDTHQFAGGVMQLNMTVMTTLLGALTTLLVMLIQFDASERSATAAAVAAAAAEAAAANATAGNETAVLG